ncbi:MAG: F0F1 ATP synthase subunit delta [Clostridia bacterium]|nr:F0F1 ATP synthase subunit delta [Clostridia bacterium]
MLNNAIARRYANAFFAIAKEKDALDSFEKELDTVVSTIEANADLKRVMDDQLLSAEAKKDIVDKVFEGNVSATTVDFLKVVIDKRREGYIRDILDAFIAYANEARNIFDAEVISAHPLAEVDIESLKAQLSKMTGKNIRLKTAVNPQLIGGLTVRIGDKVIDGTVNRRLNVLQDLLLKN